MDNTVKVTVTVTADGQEFTKSATGATGDNPFRLADSVLNAVSAEVSRDMSEPKHAWDTAQRRATRPLRRGY